MPRKVLSVCMFCDKEPCACPGTVTKKQSKSSAGTTRKKVDGETPSSVPTPTPSPAASVDVKAAMKNAAASVASVQTTKPAPVECPASSSKKSTTEETSTGDDAELLDCLNVLREIVHPDDLAPYQSAMWRRRHGKPA